MIRNTATSERHRRIISRGKPPCHICGEPIDYSAKWLDPLSFQIDHVIPLHKGGTDTLDNCAPSHRYCNRQRGDRLPGWQSGVTFVTDRIW